MKKNDGRTHIASDLILVGKMMEMANILCYVKQKNTALVIGPVHYFRV